MGAPERIWAYPMVIIAGEPDWAEGGEWLVGGASPIIEDTHAEYVRADILAARDAEIERLKLINDGMKCIGEWRQPETRPRPAKGSRTPWS